MRCYEGAFNGCKMNWAAAPWIPSKQVAFKTKSEPLITAVSPVCLQLG